MISSNLRNPAAKLSWLLCVGLMCLLFNSAYANTDPAATVLFSQGTVTLSNAKISHDLTKGSTIQAGDTITTGNNGRVQLRFSDGGMMALVPNSEFAVDEYLQPSANDEGKAHFNLVKGGLRTISGSIGKKSPDSYQLKTRVATLGIRGTEFLVTMSDDQMGVHVGEGRVSLANDMGQLLVNVGQSAVVMMGEAPQLSSQPVTLAAASSTNAAAEDDEENDTNSTQSTTADNSATTAQTDNNSASTGTDNSLTANLSAIDKITDPEVRDEFTHSVSTPNGGNPPPPSYDEPFFYQFSLAKGGFDGAEHYDRIFDAESDGNELDIGNYLTERGLESGTINFAGSKIDGNTPQLSLDSGFTTHRKHSETDRLVWGVVQEIAPPSGTLAEIYTPFILGNATGVGDLTEIIQTGTITFSLNSPQDAFIAGMESGSIQSNFENGNVSLAKLDLTVQLGLNSPQFGVDMSVTQSIAGGGTSTVNFAQQMAEGFWVTDDYARFNVVFDSSRVCQDCTLNLGGMITGESAQAAGVVFKLEQASQSDPQFIGAAKLGRKP